MKEKLTYEIEFAFKFEIFEVSFKKKMIRFPLLLDGGVRGFLILGQFSFLKFLVIVQYLHNHELLVISSCLFPAKAMHFLE